MTIHFIADTHLDHDGVLEMSGRLFRNIVEHNDCLIDSINRHVTKQDRLYVLGDVAWNSVDNYLDRIVCKDIHLIVGNHDKNNFGKKFKTSQDVLDIKIGPKPNQTRVFMSHYPHAFWPASHHGAFHLYGHCHRQRESTLDAAFPGRRSLDVGVDNALALLGEYRPFSEHDIIRILGPRPGHDLIEFYDRFQATLPKYRGACKPAGRPVPGTGVDHRAPNLSLEQEEFYNSPLGVPYTPRCAFIPPVPGYDGCTRDKGHEGPCAHEYKDPEYYQ
jgi:calcineurin-like phosphoesterase family protein